ncbi:SirB2 family protein [Neptuniibacter sp.]|uniref:SirB2 family protein n=1 Tax=Neptuniibacter sp. TaxID=1962643 RepID=UPI003B5A75AD
MSYLAVKHIHLLCILTSLILFIMRGSWALYYPEKLQQKWIKVIPHIVDTVLLISGLSLAFLLQQYPFVDHWLTAKVLALCLYIGLGSAVIKGDFTTPWKLLAFLAAISTFFYIVSVAMSHSPQPWAV